MSSSGGSAAGPFTVVKTKITYATPDIATGVVVYTPKAGDKIFDLFCSVPVAWNGTTPVMGLGRQGNAAAYWTNQILTTGDAPQKGFMGTDANFSRVVYNFPDILICQDATPIIAQISQGGWGNTVPAGATAGEIDVYLTILSA